MANEKVTARLMEDGNEKASVEVEYDFGGDLAGAVKLFGEEAVFSRFIASARVDLQSVMRRQLDQEKVPTAKEIQKTADEWKPGATTRTRKSKVDKANDLVGTMSDEEKAALIKSLTAK